MRNFFKADYFFDTVYEITPEFLKENSITAVVADLDNTLADYDTLDPTAQLLAWLESMRASGVQVAIVSNNARERVERFCKELNIPFFWKSGKPRPAAIRRAMAEMGAERENTAMLGDKLSTDVLGARLSGIGMLRVRSIKPRWKRSRKS